MPAIVKEEREAGALAIEQIPRASCGPDEVFIKIKCAADYGTDLYTPVVIKKR